MRMARKAAATALAVALSACGGLQHTKVTAPAPTRAAAELDRIGLVTASQAVGDVLYVAGTRGLGAVKADGTVVWATELPEVYTRGLAVDGERLAFTQYGISGSEKGVFSFYSGSWDKRVYTDCAVGLASSAGKVAWTTPCEAGEAASAPAIGAGRVAVSHGQNLGLYDLETGKRLSSTSIPTAALGLNSSFINQASYNAPVFLDGAFFVAHFNKLAKVKPDGQIVEETKYFNLFRPFENITAGPVLAKDVLVFAGMPSPRDEKVLLYAGNKKLSKEWDDRLGDNESGVGSIVARGDRLYLANNFHVWAYKASGSELWHVKGGLPVTASKLRGTFAPDGARRRWKNNMMQSSETFQARRWNGSLIAASDTRVYLSSRIERAKDKYADVITVLDAASGDYVETIDLGAELLDLAVLGQKLAVSTAKGLVFL